MAGNNSRNRRRADREPAARRFTISMQRKLVVLFILVLLAFVGLGINIYAISRDNGNTYKKQVLSQQSYDSRVIDYKRGTIMDAKGTVLADSELVYDVIIDAKQMLEKEYYLEPSLRAISRLGIDADKIRMVVADKGPGIPDIALAMQEGYSTARPEVRDMGFGAGMGLPNMQKNVDKLNVTSEVGVGTTVEMEVNFV